MCFTLSKVKTTGKWNWEGDEIVHEPIIRASRKVPNTATQYDIDIREFLLTKDNAVVNRELGKIIDLLPIVQQSLFRSHKKGSFDFRVQKILEYVSRNIQYEPVGRWFDAWLFPDETLEKRCGDCEDRAFLLAALLLASGISGYTVRVALGKLFDARKQKSKDHVWVMYRNEDGLWMCLEPLLLSTEAEKKLNKLSRKIPGSQQTHFEYIPYFAFNDAHLWKITNNTIDSTFTDYIQQRDFWKKFNPEFAASVHNDLVNATLSKLNYTDRLYVQAYSLALDANPLAYDPREHFDNGYITEGWKMINKKLNGIGYDKRSLNTLANVVHSVADFYAHSSYAHFASYETNEKNIKLYDEIIHSQLHTPYDRNEFNLMDTKRFSVNEYYYKDNTRDRAVKYCTNMKIISGRFAQKGDDKQGLLEKMFIQVPYALRSAKTFPDRACLPHHNEIAVDAPLKPDEKIPSGHTLYQTRERFQKQFELRFSAAKRHINKVYKIWERNRSSQ